MSEELVKSLERQIADLSKRNSDLQSAYRRAKEERKAFKEQYEELLAKADSEFGESDQTIEALQAERDEWQAKATAAPSELAETVEKLKADIRTRDHRDAWRDAVGKELHPKATVEDLWRKVDYKPESDAVDPARIHELVAKAKAEADYLFVPPEAAGNPAAPQAKPRQPLTVGGGGDGGRGVRDTTPGQMRISKSMMGTPGWMTKNKAAAEAFKTGEYVLTDD